MQGEVYFLLFILWCGFCLWFWNRRNQAQSKSVDKGWGNLARLNGLTYTPGGGSLGGMASASKKPSVTGEYRGRELILTVGGARVSVYDSTVPIAFTTISLHTNNPAGCSLVVHESGLLRPTLGRGKDAKILEGLDPRFDIEGHPPAFVQRAQSLIAPLMRQRTTMGVNRSPFFWTSQSKLPSIALEGSHLIWQQYDVVDDTNELNEMLNLLCDLAELVEKEPLGHARGESPNAA